MLGPLMVSKKETSAQVQEDPNIAQFRALVPNVFANPEPLVARDPVEEARREEERRRGLWQQFAPEVFNAREAVDQAEAAYSEASRIHQQRAHEVMAAQNRMGHAQNSGEMAAVGALEDAQSCLVIARGYEQVARFNAEQAAERLREARETLAAATAPGLVKSR